ncbi:sulfatase family protein [Cyclobacterium marinum]|uniref:Sulfatase n=1 Tax=Cyclobacterium marinum (strain ATCC 25205 / DSM 745 / LMG 13164 / NCIMB 1802) TaxID=880070 RepID=G0IYU3_CYCMS|nr:arylsulfatase [Cyclobacterium marinum]AEL27276.1 sulfatase [Cyclobacterium marinum DSM 745]
MNLKLPGQLTYIFGMLLLLASCGPKEIKEEEKTENPNIVIIYMDDLGYGDMSAYDAGTLETPNMDKLAEGGVKFTAGYASSATCSPSRYALLTGTYPWRNKDAKILPGTAPLLIGTDEMTIPKMLKSQGYATAVVGKWHLGLGDGTVNWNEKVSPGPNEVGFDYSYIMAATQDRVPTVYLEDGMVQGLDPNDPIEVSYDKNFEGEPTGKDNPEMLKMKWHHGHNNSIVNGIPRIGFMKGGKKAQWVDEDMADHFLEKAKAYVKKDRDEPFFLYYALQQPHVPRTPHPRFEGKSGMGPRGDVILEADWCIGEFIKTLEEEGLLENTLIIFSSDNGPVLNDGYYDDAEELVGDHTPAGPLRGGKYSLFEAGTRVPFISYWKGKALPGTTDAMVSQIDIFNSLAAISGSQERTKDGKDFSQLFLGSDGEGRDALVLEATTRTAYRKGDWVLIPPYKGPAVNKFVNIEMGNDSDFQLYDLSTDLEQQNNLAEENPEKLKELLEEFIAIRGEDFVDTKGLELK